MNLTALLSSIEVTDTETGEKIELNTFADEDGEHSIFVFCNKDTVSIDKPTLQFTIKQ